MLYASHEDAGRQYFCCFNFISIPEGLVACTTPASWLIPFAPYHTGVPAEDHRGLTLTRQVAWVRFGCLDQKAGDQGQVPFVTW